MVEEAVVRPLITPAGPEVVVVPEAYRTRPAFPYLGLKPSELARVEEGA